MQKDRYISFDWAMKRMLRHKANFAVLEGLLTVLFNEKVTILEVLESEGNQQAIDDKFNRVDIKVKNSKEELIIVEIQNTREVAYMERILYGVSKAITEHIKLGSGYKDVKKVISISIVYFDLGAGKDYLYHGTTHFTGVHTHDELVVTTKQRNAIMREAPQDVFPEYYIIRVNEFNSVARTPLEEWVRYLKTGEIESDDTAPGLPEARERLRYYNMTPAERHNFDEHINAIMIQNDVMWTSREEGFDEGHEKGLQQGLEEGMKEGLAQGEKIGMEKGIKQGMDQGRQETIRQIAANLKRAGLAVEQIAQSTGLTADVISQL